MSIDQAINNNGVDTAKTNGVDSINNVQPTVVKKNKAKTAIEKRRKLKKLKKRKSIKHLMRQMKPNATDEEKWQQKRKSMRQ
ncbi:DUF1542 domain-containing protein [Staphylococcus haemolyticus]|uniref:DUF1542 domain-containing protein n=1 Tax=Staphylococcus haemolyticus TaxID=1283 RepID=UPI0034DCD071